MTRKEQIEKRIESGELQFLNEQCKRSFLGGAEWADDNPKPDKRDEIIKIMREALEYYSIEVPYEEIVQVENWCTLDCPEDCKDETHWTKRIAKVRLVGHNMKTAREAIAAVEKLEKE